MLSLGAKDLPDPLRRYLAFALPSGQQPFQRARIKHIGEMALQPGRWKPFRSEQTITARPPGFIWDAQLHLSPWPLHVNVHDSYEEGVGSSSASIARFLRLGSQRGTAEIAASALWRYLAEAVWLPIILLPSERLTWTAVNDSTARATLRDGAVTATADFHFAPDGAIERVTGNDIARSGRDKSSPRPTADIAHTFPCAA